MVHILTKESLVFFLGTFALVFVASCEGSEIIAKISGELENAQESDPDTASHINTNGDSDSEQESVHDSETGENTDNPTCGTKTVGPKNAFYINDADEVEEMKQVTHVLGSLFLGDFNADKADMSSFENLRCVDGDLVIQNVVNLRDLDVFSNLRRIKCGLVLIHNPDLEDISGLDDLDYLGGNDLYIQDNRNLPNCDAEAFLRDMLEKEWLGRICITNNEFDECEDIDLGCSYHYLESRI
jgi:hypothetical protein